MQVEEFINSENIDIFCLTETWISIDSQCFLNHLNYEVFNCMRPVGIRGGGVSIGIKKSLYSATEVATPPDMLCYGQFECKIVKIIHPDPMIICGIYRPPNGSTEVVFILKLDLLCEYLEAISSNSCIVILLGAFNLPFHSPSNNCIISSIDLIESYGFQSVFYEVSRPSSLTCVDNILINNPDLITNKQTIDSHLSDHYGQTITILTQIYSNIFTRKLNCSDRLESFVENMIAIDWTPVFDNGDCNSKTKYCIHQFKHCFELCFPNVKCKVNPAKKDSLKPSHKLRCLKKHRTELLQIRKRTTDSTETLTNELKEVGRLIRQTNIVNKYRDYWQNKINTSAGNSKETWRTLNDLTGNKNNKCTGIKTLFDQKTNKMVTDNHELAEIIKHHFRGSVSEFENVIIDDMKCMSYTNKRIEDDSRLKFLRCDENIIGSIIEGLNTKKSTGLDGIPIWLYKVVKQIIAPVIVEIINSGMEQGIFPQILKQAKVCAVHKKGDKELISNYSPISVLSTLSKIFEKVIYMQLEFHFAYCKLFNNNQFGFLKGKSTSQAIETFIRHVHEALNDKKMPLQYAMTIRKHLTQCPTVLFFLN